MNKAEMLARIERLEELVIAMYLYQDAAPIAQQLEYELHSQNRLATGEYPVPMENRITDIEDKIKESP